MESLTGASGGMSARIAFAVISGLFGLAWIAILVKQARQSNVPLLDLPGDGQSAENPSRTESVLAAVVLTLSGFWAVAWLAVSAKRISFPFELEWCGGAMRDMVSRALHGEALYVAPGQGWFPYEYPPLYAWVSALLMRVSGGGVSFVPLRLVSIASTIATAALLFQWVRGLAGGGGRGRTWGLISAGLFLASYRFTGAWYDVERIDMLFLALSMGAIYALQTSIERNSIIAAGLAGFLMTLAFLTKQQAILFILGACWTLVWQRKWRLLSMFGVVSGLLCAGSVEALNITTDGWFGWYCFRVPMANGIRANLAAVYLFLDLPLFAPMLGILAAFALWRPKDEQGSVQPNMGLLGAITAMGLFGSLLSRAHWGGDQNVLMTGYALLGASACVAAARFSSVKPVLAAPLLALALAQMVTVTYRPGAQIPADSNRSAGEAYSALIARLEREGPVLSLDHGGFTRTPQFQLMGLLDVVKTLHGLPAPLLSSIRTHEFAAIVMDAPPSRDGDLGEIAREYPHAENAGITQSWTVTGYPTPSPSRSVWILRP